MAFPVIEPPGLNVPTWATDPHAAKIEPTSQMVPGWVATPGQLYGPIPPYQWENWMKYATGQWIDYLKRLGAYLQTNSPIGSVNQRIITTTSTYSVPSNLIYAQVEIVGGGGSGSSIRGASNVLFGNGGGGSGAYSKAVFAKSVLPSSILITIGIAGLANLNTDGNAGEDSSFGSLIVNVGGGGGGQNVTGGNAGLASSSPNCLNIGGQGGASGNYLGSPVPSPVFAGSGGDSICGLGGAAPAGIGVQNGATGSGYGAGGSGCLIQNSASVTAGNGAPGVCIITEYLSI